MFGVIRKKSPLVPTDVEKLICSHWSLAVPLVEKRRRADEDRYILTLLRAAQRKSWRWYDAELDLGRCHKELHRVRWAMLSLYISMVRRAFDTKYVNRLLEKHGF